jgi:hypothetical protein
MSPSRRTSVADAPRSRPLTLYRIRVHDDDGRAFMVRFYVQRPAVDRQVDYWRRQGCRVTVEVSQQPVQFLLVEWEAP